MCQACAALAPRRRSRRAGWPIERALWRCPSHARRRACRAPLAAAGSTAPLQPRERRAQIQEAAHQAAECCTGLQRRLWHCGAVSPPCPRSRRAAARPSTSHRKEGAHLPKEAQDAPAAPAGLRSAAHGPRHAKPTLSLPERLSAEGLASARRHLRGHALRPGERATKSGAGSPYSGPEDILFVAQHWAWRCKILFVVSVRYPVINK